MENIGQILSSQSGVVTPKQSEPKDWTKFLESLDYDEAVVEVLNKYASALDGLGVDLTQPSLIESINAQHSCLESALEQAIACMRGKEISSPVAYLQAVLTRVFDRQDFQGSRLPLYTAQSVPPAVTSPFPPKSLEELQADLGKGRAIATLTRAMIRRNPQWGLAVIEGKVVRFLAEEELAS
jgi:hypothetical protein